MIGAGLACIAIGMALSAPAASLLIHLSRRRGWLDRAGAEPHKQPGPAVPNTGGLALYLGLAVPAAAALLLAPQLAGRLDTLSPRLTPLAEGFGSVQALGWWTLAAITLVHVTGLIDDRRGLGPWSKLAVQVAAAAMVVVGADTRALVLLDAFGPAGYALSLGLSLAWVVAITNAFNFLDNMDGLSGGVAAVAAAVFLAAAVVAQQWLVAGLAALLLGAVVGVLAYNLPPARLYFGDSGSLVLGLTLAFLSLRLTYVPMPDGGGEPVDPPWYAVLTPLVVLAVPLYDMVSVTVVRLRAGASPLRGDHNHFSHRLVRLGLGKGRAVSVIVLATGATGAAGVMLGRLAPWQAVLAALQAAAVVGTLALLEFGARRRDDDR